MVKTEQINDRLIKSYSDRGKMIAPTYDRLGKEFNSQALYSEAVDIIVDGLPRFHYIETEIDVEIDEEQEMVE